MAANPIPHQSEVVEAELLKDESSQTLRLPPDFWFEEAKVGLRRTSAGVLLVPVEAPEESKDQTKEEIRAKVRAMFARIDSYGADPLFPDGRDQGTFEVRDPIL